MARFCPFVNKNAFVRYKKASVFNDWGFFFVQTETPLAQRLKGETAAYLSKKIDIVHYTTGALRHKDTIKNPLSQKAKEGNHTKNEINIELVGPTPQIYDKTL